MENLYQTSNALHSRGSLLSFLWIARPSKIPSSPFPGKGSMGEGHGKIKHETQWLKAFKAHRSHVFSGYGSAHINILMPRTSALLHEPVSVVSRA